MIIAIVILFAGSINEILAHNWQTWLGGAILIRFGVGMAQTILVTYISEIAPFQIRGFMIGSYQLMLGIGQLISAIATKIMTDVNPDQWKPLIATEFLFTGVGSKGSSPDHRCSPLRFLGFPNRTSTTPDVAMTKRPKSACFGSTVPLPITTS